MTKRSWYAPVTAAVVLVALLALAGSIGAVGSAGAVEAQSVPLGVPAAPQSNVSPYLVLERLGRWNGTTFAPVAAASISAGHVIVLSHGWAPGYLDTYQRLQASSASLVTAWDPGMVDGAGTPLAARFTTMAQALQAADPGAAVLMFSWVDQSATSENPLDARRAEEATEVNGHRLATALDQAVAPDFAARGGQVHLIGHSFGASVATTAALAMRTPPRQLTLLDSPEVLLTRIGGAKNDLRYELPRLDLGRGATQTFVDNYISLVGERYAIYPGLGSVVDVRTNPPAGTDSDKHGFAIDWYTDSVRATGATGVPQVGYAWSPLAGGDVTAVGTTYDQPAIDAPLDLTEQLPPPVAGVTDRLAVGSVPLQVVGSPSSPRAVAVTGGYGPLTADLTFTTDTDSLWLTFDAHLSGRPGDELTIFVDGRARYVASARADVGGIGADGGGASFNGGGPPGAMVVLFDVSPGSHVLSATISGPIGSTPDAGSSALVTDLAIATTGDITRNLTATQTRRLATGAIAVAAAVVVLVIGLAALAVAPLIGRRRRRRAARRSGEGSTAASP